MAKMSRIDGEIRRIQNYNKKHVKMNVKQY